MFLAVRAKKALHSQLLEGTRADVFSKDRRQTSGKKQGNRQRSRSNLFI